MSGQDDHLLGLIAAKRWKPALDMCEKLLKKTKDSDTLLATKISILFQWPDKSRNEQGAKEFESLIERKPPVTDPAVLRRLEGVIKEEGSPPKLTAMQTQMWQRAATSRPQDEDLHQAWYFVKFDQGNYGGAQHACMIWMKNFPKERKPFFLYIICTYLISDRTTNESEKKLAQALAYKCLSKAAADAPEKKVSVPEAGRHIHSKDELFLLLRVYRAQQRYKEAYDLLIDSRIGISTYPGVDKWEICRQYTDILELKGWWVELHQICRGILEGSLSTAVKTPSLQVNFGAAGDDWKVWQGFLRASNEHNPDGETSETEALILSTLGSRVGSSTRNSCLALITLYSSQVFEGRCKQERLLTAITKYFRDFSSKTTCFQDLRPGLSHLDLEGQEHLLLNITTITQDTKPKAGDSEPHMIGWITREVNVLKLEYYLLISRDENCNRTSLLLAFISSCLRLYKLSSHFGLQLPVSDRRPGDDAALLAAMGLIRLFKQGKKPALLQSVIVLEHLLSHSKHNYDALLILVRLYVFLGAGSLAMDRYSRLSIKNLQYATISWVLYTRISTIHPYPATYNTNDKHISIIDPKEDIDQILSWHRSAEDLSRKAVHNMQANNQWDMSLDSLATCETVLSSFIKSLAIVEKKRIMRLRSMRYLSTKTAFSTYTTPELETLKLTLGLELPERTKDTRDRTAFPSFEGGSLTFEEHLPMAGTTKDPNDIWLGKELYIAWFADKLQNNGQSDLKVDEVIAFNQALGGEDPDVFTGTEDEVMSIVGMLVWLHSLWSEGVKHDTSNPKESMQLLFENLDNWVVRRSKFLELGILSETNASMPLTLDLKIPLWNFFHDRYSLIDACRLVTLTLDYVISENTKECFVEQSWLSNRIDRLRSNLKKLSEVIRRSATDLRNKFLDQGVFQQINSAVLGNIEQTEDYEMLITELRDLGDLSTSETFCQDIRESWIEGLNGVIQTKVV